MGGVHLWEVSTYGRCPFTGGFKCRVLVEKLLGPQFVVHLWEVSAYGRCPLVTVSVAQRSSFLDLSPQCLLIQKSGTLQIKKRNAANKKE